MLHTVNNRVSANAPAAPGAEHFRGSLRSAALPGLRSASPGSLNASFSPSRSSCPLGRPASALFQHLVNDTNDDSDAQPQRSARPRRRRPRGRFAVWSIERSKLATPVVKVPLCPVCVLIRAPISAAASVPASETESVNTENQNGEDEKTTCCGPLW